MKRIVGEDGALIAKPVNREGTVTVVTCARSVSRRCDVFFGEERRQWRVYVGGAY